MDHQSTVDFIGKNFQGLLLASLLYPLDRIQSIQQIQASYSALPLRTTPAIAAHAVHHGVHSYFRGFLPFVTKATLLTAAVRTTQIDQTSKGWGQRDWAGLALGVLGYSLLYPLEIVSLHMSAEVDRQRFYNNARECVSKIKRNQGLRTLYRGLVYSCTIFALQLGSVKYARQQIEGGGEGQSEWERIGLLLGLFGASELLFYPFNTVKKLYQINGAMGHTDDNFSVARTVSTTPLGQLFRGGATRAGNLGLYCLVYVGLLGGEEKQ